MDTLYLADHPTPKSYDYSKLLADIKSVPSTLSDDKKLSKTIGLAFMACRMHQALELLMRLETPANHPFFQDIINSAEIFTAAGLSDDEAEQLQLLAFGLLKKANLTVSYCELSVLNTYVHYEIFVDLPISQIPELDFELARAFAANVENMRDDVIIFEYRSMAARP